MKNNDFSPFYILCLTVLRNVPGVTSVDRQRTPSGLSGVRYLHCILPCLILRVRVKSEAQPKGTKQPNVLGANRYCLDEEVWLSSSHNPSVYIYIIASDSALWHRQSGNDIDSV